MSYSIHISIPCFSGSASVPTTVACTASTGKATAVGIVVASAMLDGAGSIQ